MADTHYAVRDGAHIAYQVVGDGPLDLLFVQSWFSNIEVLWESPTVSRYLQRLASFSRLILFDPRGSGLSDDCAASDLTMDLRKRDALAVLDAAGSDRAALFGSFYGGPVAIDLAATVPERFSALVLYNTSARWLEAADYPFGQRSDDAQHIRDLLPEVWGRSNLALPDTLSGSQSAWWQRFQRMSFGPGTAARVYSTLIGDDVRAALAEVLVPTLIVHRTDNSVTPLAHGRHLAEQIPDARLIELEGEDAGWFFDAREAVLDEVQEFLIGTRSDVAPDRAVATVLFTDLVGSTVTTARLGDDRWRDELDAHDAMLARAVARYGGQVANKVGDGALVLFERPSLAIRCAQDLTAEAARLGFAMRVGIHTGEIERRGSDVAGLAIVIAERVMHLAPTNQVIVTSTVREISVGSTTTFESVGDHELKGVPGRWTVFIARGASTTR